MQYASTNARVLTDAFLNVGSQYPFPPQYLIAYTAYSSTSSTAYYQSA